MPDDETRTEQEQSNRTEQRRKWEDELAMHRMAHTLEEAGYSFFDAKAAANAVYSGNFTAAAEIQRRYNERSEQSPEAQEHREDAELRRAFGLPPR